MILNPSRNHTTLYSMQAGEKSSSALMGLAFKDIQNKENISTMKSKVEEGFNPL